MKPITLKLAGLQSYREMQTIDFTELCETGLFGIFGPTGSGKSTILDAITLALYGKVGRASGGTQGIMNHLEDALFVAFTFELTSAAGTERYRVERRFKRQGELSVSNTISRFIEILPDDEEKVIADKLADVTRCVEQKLGLKMDDFTRAVVLPQGKFAEFLSLKGADRRAMLQRLFHLEKYGDLLGQKLTRKVRANEQRRAEVAAEQQGLGNASAEALEQAAAAVQEAAALAAERRRELLHAQQRYDQLAKVRELAVERAERAAQLEALRAQGGEIAALEAKLARGSAAEALRPVLTAWQEAQRAAAARALAAAEAEQAARAAAAAAAEASAAAEAAAAALGREEPALLVRLEQLEQARSLQEEAARLGAELQRLAAQRAEGAQRKQLLAEQTAKEELLLAKAQTRQRELEQQMKATEVKAEERQQAQAAVGLAQQLAALQEQLAQAEQEETAARTSLQQAEGKLEQIVREVAEVQLSSQTLAGQLAEAALELTMLEKELQQHAAELNGYEHSLRQALKERERHLWAARLAEQLHDGEPCPVCGSAHHPAPAEAEDDGITGGEAELEELAALIAEARELQFAVARDRDACSALLQALAPAGGATSASGGEAAASAEAAAAALAASPAGLAALQRRATGLAERHTACRRRLEALQRDGRAAQSALAVLQPQRAAAEAAEAAASGQLKQTAARSAQHREALAAKQREWAELYPGLSPEEAARQMEAYAAKDRLAEDLRGRLDVSVPFIEEKTAKLQALTGEIIELDKTLVQWEVQEQGKQELLREKQERLHAVAGERPVDELLAEAREKLATLRQQAERSRAMQTETAARSHELAKAEALAAQAAAAARDQEAELQVRWVQALKASPFEEEASVLNNLLAPGEAELLVETVQQHRSREQELVISLSELDAKLAGQTVSDEEWQYSGAALAAAKEQDEAALQLKARAERDWEDLQVRHVRWQELEQVRSQLEHEAGLLAKLQSALRGNAFVEYVAEEQLMNVSHAASQRLRFLTKQRYALETDSGGGFVIRDDASGGVKRPVATLSGGETFLASLALALALSAQIQLRGQYPLQFFFLDEGFGTLDPELLDTVITSLEHLHHDHLSVGIISHVAELQTRLARKLVVIPAESGGAGSQIKLERL
ncbi:AAA family ATPase [Paenibacillus barengoltzii]|uniref:Nuclease SbcCD subunit C n=1 Tax=Paenibacillus barengoltzii J12 TaxID=935846 RepID=A0ABY1LYP4_9BACL|nr:AAA family ATPase [Paenibacillus barengoltzii]SMF35627.1 exonuclease SbcC [Paenibacillus barengoltzii J12]